MKFKRDIVYILVIVLLLGAAGQAYYSCRYRPRHLAEVYYNQQRELNKEIIRLTREADRFVYFAIYTFTRTDIKDALLAAKYRGLEVKGVIDREQSAQLQQQREIVAELREKGITIYEQDHYAIMHLKTLVTDKAYASGSFNWTSAATNLNDEVLEIGSDEAMRQKYLAVLEELFRRYGPGQNSNTAK